MTSPADRDALLADEFTRAVPAGLRVFSPGIFQLARTMGIGVAAADNAPQPSGELVTLALVWMLDLRNSLDAVRQAAEQGSAFLSSPELAEYGLAINLPFYMAAKAEIDRTNRAVELALFRIHPRPGDGAASTPPGKP